MFTRISTQEAKRLIDEEQAQIVDIRDPQSFAAGHIPGAVQLNNDNLQDYVDNADCSKPLLVCCYHGNMSKGAAEFFSSQGFLRSYSLNGGYTEWAKQT